MAKEVFFNLNENKAICSRALYDATDQKSKLILKYLQKVSDVQSVLRLMNVMLLVAFSKQ